MTAQGYHPSQNPRGRLYFRSLSSQLQHYHQSFQRHQKSVTLFCPKRTLYCSTLDTRTDV